MVGWGDGGRAGRMGKIGYGGGGCEGCGGIGLGWGRIVVPYCCGSLLFLLSVFILWFIYYVSDIFCKF